jgi:hypothetical protein
MANAWGELDWSAGNWGEQSNVTEQVTGLSTSIALNSVDSYPNEGWGSDFWGSENWGESAYTVPVTGLQQNIDITNPDIAIGQQVDVTGQQQNLSLNSPNIDIAVEVFLNQNPLPNLTVSEGTVDASPDAVATGQQQNLSTGTLDAYNRQGWGRYFFGEEEWGASGLWETVSVTGQQLNIGTNASTDVDVSVTVELDTVDDPGWGGGQVAWGNQEWGQAEVSMAMTMGEGTVDPSPDAMAEGIGMTVGVGLGTVTADANTDVITGQQVNIAQGQAELDAVTFGKPAGQNLKITLQGVVAGTSVEVDLVGNGLTLELNSINVQSWQIVDTGTNVNWNIIDTAA